MKKAKVLYKFTGLTTEEKIKTALFAAKLVLPVYESFYPKNTSVRKAIRLGKTAADAAAADDAAVYAAVAVDAAVAAADADAAADAAAVDAAYAAVDADAADAADAAAAAVDAAYAAYAAVDAVAAAAVKNAISAGAKKTVLYAFMGRL